MYGPLYGPDCAAPTRVSPDKRRGASRAPTVSTLDPPFQFANIPYWPQWLFVSGSPVLTQETTHS